MPSKKATSNSNSEKVSNVQQQKCTEIMNELNGEIAKKCQSKHNRLEKCSKCEIKNKEWVQINSKFDAYLLNTAYDGAGGFIPSGTGVDSQWEVGIGDATGPSSVATWIPAFVYKNNAWTPSPFSNANWISMYDNGNHSGNKIYYYRIRFYLNSSINPSDFQLDMSFFADNSVSNIYVNNAGQAANYPTLLPQGSGSNSYTFKGFQASNGVDISLNKDWKECENEIIVEVHSGAPYMGFLAQNTSKCYEADIPEYAPQIDIKWGDSKCDCLESDDLETMCLTVCNPYSNIDFNGFKIGKIEIFDEQGKPVQVLPNGDPSIAIVPAGPFCFGDIAACSCVSREFVLVNKGAIGGKYKIRVSGICYDVCHNYLNEACFELEICQD